MADAERTSPFGVAAALRAMKHSPEPLAHPLPLRHARAVVLAVTAAAVDHEAVRSVPTGWADAVGERTSVVESAPVAVPDRVLSAPRIPREYMHWDYLG